MVSRRQLLKISALGTASFAAPLAYSASDMTMTHNTGNSIGSPAPNDLSENARNLDLLVSGVDPLYPDRKGVPRKSWKGMEIEHSADQSRRDSEFGGEQLRRVTEFDVDQSERKAQFNTFMDASGYEPPVPYTSGLKLFRLTQSVTYLGNQYRVKSSFMPLTLTNWKADESKLKMIGDDSLRQELADPNDPDRGAGKLGRATRQIHSIAELLTVPGRYHGDQISLTAYYNGWAACTNPEPTGAGRLIWDSFSTATPDLGKVFAVTGTSTGRWKRPGRDYVDSDYGVVGDGADESAPWSRLLASIVSGGTVKITRRSRALALVCNANSVKITTESSSYIESPAILLHAATSTPLLTLGGYGCKIDSGAFEDGSVENGAVNMGSVGVRLKRLDGTRDVDAQVTNSFFNKFDIGLHIVGINVRVDQGCIFGLCLRPILVDQVGIEIVRGIRIKGSRFHGRPNGLIDFCLTINGTAQAEIEVTGNIADGVGGFYKGHLSRRSRISDNSVATPAGDAFLFTGGAYGKADNNTVGGGEGNGMIFDGCVSPSAANNSIDSVVKNGIVLKNCISWKLRGNDVTNVNRSYKLDKNVYDGIFIESTCSVGILGDNFVRQLNALSGRYGIANFGNQTRITAPNITLNFAGQNFFQLETQRVYGNAGFEPNGPRVHYGTTPPKTGTWGIADTVKNTLTSASSPVSEWECTVPGSPGVWRPRSWICFVGSTALRPILRSDDIGVTYLDTTLAAGGKPIWWRGTNWGDAKGAVV